jgi:WD40 repeat protein
VDGSKVVQASTAAVEQYCTLHVSGTEAPGTCITPPVRHPPLPAQVPSRVLSVAWSADGMHLALGCFDGSISIRDKAGAEQVKVAMSSAPVWTVTWCPQVGRASRGGGGPRVREFACSGCWSTGQGPGEGGRG